MRRTKGYASGIGICTLAGGVFPRPDRVFPRNELIGQVQGYAFDGYDRTIDTHIKNLRKKMAAVLADKEVILSVYGVGYKLRNDDN